jgi:hypothetical protein
LSALAMASIATTPQPSAPYTSNVARASRYALRMEGVLLIFTVQHHAAGGGLPLAPQFIYRAYEWHVRGGCERSRR